jgi:hypothetical protein
MPPILQGLIPIQQSTVLVRILISYDSVPNDVNKLFRVSKSLTAANMHIDFSGSDDFDLFYLARVITGLYAAAWVTKSLSAAVEVDGNVSPLHISPLQAKDYGKG